MHYIGQGLDGRRNTCVRRLYIGQRCDDRRNTRVKVLYIDQRFDDRRSNEFCPEIFFYTGSRPRGHSDQPIRANTPLPLRFFADRVVIPPNVGFFAECPPRVHDGEDVHAHALPRHENNEMFPPTKHLKAVGAQR